MNASHFRQYDHAGHLLGSQGCLQEDSGLLHGHGTTPCTICAALGAGRGGNIHHPCSAQVLSLCRGTTACKRHEPGGCHATSGQTGAQCFVWLAVFSLHLTFRM